MFEVSEVQRVNIKAQIKNYFGEITLDLRDIEELTNLVIDDVIDDIEETADWSDLDSDEIVMDDVDIALVRVLKTALENK